MPSIYSFLAAIVWFNIAMLVVAVLSRKTYFLVKYSTSVLLICAALGIVRMLLPLDFTFTHIIRSYSVMPIVRDIFKGSISFGPVLVQTATVVFGVWGIGTIVVCAKIIHQLYVEHQARREYRVVHNKQIQRICTEMGLKNAKIIVSSDISMPMMTGIFKEYIYLPDMDLSNEQWKIIILHEHQHFKSHDTLIKLFYLMLAAFFWWNPAVHKFRSRLDDLLELRCDANVTKKMDDESKVYYLGTILDVMKKAHGFEHEEKPMVFSSLVEANADCLIKRRFQAVLSDAEKSQVIPKIMVVGLLLLFLSSYMIVVQPAGNPPGDETEAGVRITPENAYILVLEGGSMQLYVDGEFFWDVNEAERYDDLHSELPIREESN